MKISIIIINYNKKKLLQKCLQSVDNVLYDNFNVIVVDNGSTDGSIELVKEQYTKYILIDMGYNSSFCIANNVGIRKAFELGSDAVVLLNNDTEVEQQFLTALVDSVSLEDRIGMVASKVLLMGHKDVIDSTGILITPDGLAKNKNMDELASSSVKSEEVFCPAGATALYTKELLEDIEDNSNFFDEKYAFYFEELDLGWRARLRGWNCIYNPNAVVYHIKNATSGAYSEFIAFHTNRNIFYNIIKNYSFGYCVKALFLTFMRYPLLALGVLTGRGAAEKFQGNITTIKLINIVLKGWRDVIKNLRILLTQRRYIQRKKNVTRKEINRWFKELGLTFFDSLYK